MKTDQPGAGPLPPVAHAATVGDAPPLVRLEDVHKAFGSQQVLKGITFSLVEGATTVVLGPSGSGKSVILKHIAGLIKPDRGRILFDGEPIERLPERALAPIRQQMGYLFQQSALFDSMTVEENLAFPLIEHTTTRPEARRERIRQALATVDLHDVENKFPSELSGGMQKRAALARAIILDPRLILYDEPTTGLDPIRADGISSLILKLKRERGVTGVVVTHDLACTRRVADRVVMIGGGVVIFDGTMDEMQRTEDERVQDFLSGHSRDANGNGDRGNAAGKEPD